MPSTNGYAYEAHSSSMKLILISVLSSVLIPITFPPACAGVIHCGPVFTIHIIVHVIFAVILPVI